MPTEYATFTIRIPVDLAERLHLRSQINGRTRNMEITQILKRAVNTPEDPSES